MLLIGMASLIVGCSGDNTELINSAMKMKEKLGGKDYIAGYYSRVGEGCIFMYKKESGSWEDFFKILDLNVGESIMKARKSQEPYLAGIAPYTREEIYEACNEIDKNPVNGNNDGLAVPEETRATLRYKLDKKL